MRIFLAITVPDEVKANLAAAVKRLSPIAPDITWYKRDQFHLTLAFLGEASPAILPHVTAATERVCAKHAVFACRAYGFGFFGTKRNPKTLWAGVDLTPELDGLRDALWEELEKFGFEGDKTDFRPHITLGKSREATRNHPVIEAMDEDENIAFGEWDVTRVTLCESRTSPHGMIYRDLANTALA